MANSLELHIGFNSLQQLIINYSKKKMTNQQSADVVIITALDKERDAVRRYLDAPEKVQIKNRTVYKSNLRHNNAESSYQVVLLCLNNMGSVTAGIATTQAIDVWNPSLIILVGITGGIENGDERYLGDLIAAEQIVGYESGKLTDAGAERRFEVLRSTPAFLEAARNFPDEKWVLAPTVQRPDGKDGRVIPKIHWGVVASGEKVIADTKTVPELQNHWAKLAGIEMEGYGTALAAYTAESRPEFFMVKGICDWANPKKNDEWQEYAADVAATFVVNLLKSKPFFSQSDDGITANDESPRLVARRRLKDLLPAQFNDILFLYDVPDEYLSITAPQMTQISELIKYALQQEGEQLTQLLEVITQVCGKV
jgi:nucleoside phosphorylase